MKCKYTVRFIGYDDEDIEANTLRELINRLLNKCDGRLEVKE